MSTPNFALPFTQMAVAFSDVIVKSGNAIFRSPGLLGPR
jgi:hypothetical protein